ncbi:hypothetical protein ATANTOWER_026913 [Ataeniobius toweri]|uniref:Uncharacterized protein n=1 Tax=Ataeniobius toweri TaxID=208326 RepID=A0ABU7ATK5_9TELE|nr:hypothetical protein [Ataeniobius toweri]
MTHLKPSASELQPDGPVRIAPLPASVQTACDWIGEPMESTGRLCLQLEDNNKEPQINRQEAVLFQDHLLLDTNSPGRMALNAPEKACMVSGKHAIMLVNVAINI